MASKRTSGYLLSAAVAWDNNPVVDMQEHMEEREPTASLGTGTTACSPDAHTRWTPLTTRVQPFVHQAMD